MTSDKNQPIKRTYLKAGVCTIGSSRRQVYIVFLIELKPRFNVTFEKRDVSAGLAKTSMKTSVSTIGTSKIEVCKWK